LTKWIKATSVFLIRKYKLFLTKAERDLLLQREEMAKNKQRYIRYKLRRKIKQFYDVELPLLVDKGYIVNNNGSGVAAYDYGVAAGSHIYHHHQQRHGYKNNDNHNNDDIHEKHEINDNKKRARQKEIEVCKLGADNNTCRRIYNPICLWTNYSRRATDVSAAS
jgi:hypothetical protein